MYDHRMCMKEDNPCLKNIKEDKEIIICTGQGESCVIWLTVLVLSVHVILCNSIITRSSGSMGKKPRYIQTTVVQIVPRFSHTVYAWVRLIHAIGIFQVSKCLQIERNWSQSPIFQCYLCAIHVYVNIAHCKKNSLCRH